MAPTKLFITGATGYIGGSVLESLIAKLPDLEITALLRSPSQEFKERYSKVKIVKGDFDAFDVIDGAAQNADIVIHTGDIDHPGCAKAILSGVSKRKSPTYVIHLTGTGCISDERDQTWQGHYNPHQWHDIAEINELYDLPDSAQHHVIDKWFMDAGAGSELVKTAVICPPDIYGQSRGIGGRATFMVPNYVEVLMRDKEAFYLGKGENIRAVTHIDDVVDLFVLVVGEAVKGGGKADWGREGFYFAVSDGIVWKEAAEAINKIGQEQGWLPRDSKTVSWNKEQVGALLPPAPGRVLYLWGSNSRGESARARKLGWKPHGPSFWEALAEDCEVAYTSAMAKAEAKMG